MGDARRAQGAEEGRGHQKGLQRCCDRGWWRSRASPGRVQASSRLLPARRAQSFEHRLTPLQAES